MARSNRQDITAQALHCHSVYRNPKFEWFDCHTPNSTGQPHQKILILTITDEEQVIREILEAGARGFVLKSDAARDLVAAVEALQAGTMFFTSRVAEMVLRTYLNQKQDHSEDVPISSSLTSRERQIVQLVAEGKSTKEVASMLDLSIKTVERYRANIMRKLGFHSRSELVLYAVRNHIIQVTSQ